MGLELLSRSSWRSWVACDSSCGSLEEFSKDYNLSGTTPYLPSKISMSTWMEGMYGYFCVSEGGGDWIAIGLSETVRLG